MKSKYLSSKHTQPRWITYVQLAAPILALIDTNVYQKTWYELTKANDGYKSIFDLKGLCTRNAPDYTYTQLKIAKYVVDLEKCWLCAAMSQN